MSLTTILCVESYSQIIFEKGYFINDSNKKIECFIKNIDWKNNPTDFEYKLSINDKIKKATIQTVNEFGINNVFKYIRAKVEIDRSSDQIDEMSSERNPNFQEELLFLKVLIEGEASLFLYIDGNLTRFFYKTNDCKINQLVHKKYLNYDNISTNNYFKQQLSLQLKCKEIQLYNFKNIRYNKRDLERLFIKYHECKNYSYTYIEKKNKKDLFNLTIRPGVNYSSLEIENPESESKTDFGNNIGIRFGIEAEFILPFHKNKWSIIIEPTYQHYKSEQSKETSNVSGGVLISKINYKSIEIPIGLRYYFYLNNKSKIFTNISYSMYYDFNSKITLSRKDNSTISSLEINSKTNIAVGIGYKFKDIYSIEMRYGPSRNLLSKYLYWDSNYRVASIAIGYSLF